MAHNTTYYLAIHLGEKKNYEIININSKFANSGYKEYTYKELLDFLQKKCEKADTIVYGIESYQYNSNDHEYGITLKTNNQIYAVINPIPQIIYDIFFNVSYLKLQNLMLYNDPHIITPNNLLLLLSKNNYLKIFIYLQNYKIYSRSLFKCLDLASYRIFIKFFLIMTEYYELPIDLFGCIREYFMGTASNRIHII